MKVVRNQAGNNSSVDKIHPKVFASRGRDP